MRTGDLGGPRTRRPEQRRRASQASADLRPALRLERRTAPAALLISGLAAYGAMGADIASPLVLGWLAAAVVSVALRFALAQQFAQAPLAIQPDEPPARLHALSYVVDLLLWAALLLAVAPPASATGGAVAVAAAGRVLLASLPLGRRPQLWLLFILGWGVVCALAAARPGVANPQPFALAFPAWLLAVWWLGRAQGRARASGRAPVTLSGLESRTRFGWLSAVQAMPAPVVVVRNGRIVDINDAALKFVGASAQQLIGASVEEALRADPPAAFDARFAQDGERTVRVRPANRTFDDVAPWSARVRVLNPGESDSAVIVLLTRPAERAAEADEFAAEAKRLIHWLGRGEPAGAPWYRDERGQLVLPEELSPALSPLPQMSFPLAPWVIEAERAAVEADYLRAIARGQPFERDLTLVDRNGARIERRVLALTRVAQTPGLMVPVVGRLDPVAPRAATEAPPAAADSDELTQHLPVLVWAVDANGRVVRVQGSEPWRWGMKDGLAERPLWSEACDLRATDREPMLAALRAALNRKPTFDLLNSRNTRTGGRIVLRSHVVPYRHQGREAVLVLDTIASPRQISEIDRLRRSKQQYKELVEASTSLIWACDAHFNFTFVSRRAAREIYGYEAQDLVGRSLASLLAPQVDQSAAHAALARLRVGQPLKQFEMTQQARDGQRVVVAVDAAPLFAGDRVFVGAVGMNSDLTMLKQRERRLTEALRIERTVLDSAGQAIAVVKDGLAVRCNAAFLKLLNTQPALLARTPVADFFAAVTDWNDISSQAETARSSDRAISREVQIIRGGRAVALGSAWCQLTARSIAPGEYVLVLADIDHIRSREAEALHHAHHDELTGLPNRRLLTLRGGAALAASDLRNGQCAVFVIDLDGFKEINDVHGHPVGDAVLREIAQRLSRLLRPQDTVARRGGDEFVMLVPDVGERADVERIAVRLLQAVEQPVAVGGGQVGHVSASVGIALSPEHARELERLLQLADHAMYDAKQKGKNRYAFASTANAAATVTPLAPRAARAS
jgi:diguanylate cyclase (GGDEF)-like protein/PAS domain S-box-containing protein